VGRCKRALIVERREQNLEAQHIDKSRFHAPSRLETWTQRVACFTPRSPELRAFSAGSMVAVGSDHGDTKHYKRPCSRLDFFHPARIFMKKSRNWTLARDRRELSTFFPQNHFNNIFLSITPSYKCSLLYLFTDKDAVCSMHSPSSPLRALCRTHTILLHLMPLIRCR
jgi:hypothetical protein